MASWVKGNAAELDAAVQAAADLLEGARAPVFAGLCADVAAIRAAYRLAETVGASLDPVAGPSLYAELGALSAGGGLTTTAPETIGRADVVLVVGEAPWRSDRLGAITTSNPLRGRAAGLERSVLSLGGPGEANAAQRYGTDGAGPLVVLGHLRAIVRGNLVGETGLGDLATRLKGALYGVVVHDPGELGASGVEMLNGLVKDLNETTRVFALSLADPWQGRSATQLSAWTTGQAPRVGFGRHMPEHDPWRFDSSRQIASGEADAAMWLATLPAPRPDWLGTLPSVAILGEGEADGHAAEVVIGVGVPGKGIGGALWNERRGVIAYVEGNGGARTTAADILARIHDRLAEGRA